MGFKVSEDLVKKRYAIEGESSIEEVYQRVAKKIYPRNKQNRERLFDMMSRGEFLFNTPCLRTFGDPVLKNCAAACYVVNVDDSLNGIYEALKRAADITAVGGGTGFDFSKIRPIGSRIKNVPNASAGVVATIKLFDGGTDFLKQGLTRKGANMGVLNLLHPDIISFVEAKLDGVTLSNFNLSVMVPGQLDMDMTWGQATELYRLPQKEFEAQMPEYLHATSMKKLGWGKWVQEYDWESHSWYNKPLTACFKEIAIAAHKCGCPGLLFSETINKAWYEQWSKAKKDSELTSYQKEQSYNKFEPIVMSNPCGEQLLLADEACLLGSINLMALSHMYPSDLEFIVKTMNRALDISEYPSPEIEAKVKKYRRIGIGFMGVADFLLDEGVDYDSEEARQLVTDLISQCTNLIKYYGKAYGNFSTTTIAPTGTISMLAGVGSGIEPIFAATELRRQLGTEVTEPHRSIERYFENHGITSEEDKEQFIASVVTAPMISPLDHLKMVAAVQPHIDAGISKTINCPEDTTVDMVYDIYLAAISAGLKGITIYRDGSKANQVLTDAGKVVVQDSVRHGETHTIKTGKGQLHATINKLNGRPVEVFLHLGKSGTNSAAAAEGLGRMISLALRFDVPVEEIVHQLSGIRGDSRVFQPQGSITSIEDAVAKLLVTSIQDTDKKLKTSDVKNVEKPCPDCGGELLRVEGCIKCMNIDCGYSGCA